MKSYALSHPALMVIDVQRYFFNRNGGAFLENSPAILPNILKLVDAFRKAKFPIVMTRHAHKAGEPMGQMGRWWNERLPIEGTVDAELIDQLSQVKGEILLTKTLYSAFEGTDLDKTLKNLGVDHLFFCGVMTNLCVETTARHAFMKNYQPIIVEDACAANTPEHHRASILNLSYGFASISDTDAVIEAIASKTG